MYNVSNARIGMGISGDKKKPGLPLCKISFLQDTEANKIAVILCMNHAIGDAHTLFKIWKMLDVSEPVISMKTERIQNISELINSRLKRFIIL